MASSPRTPPWDKNNPVKPKHKIKLTDAQKAQAKARADAAGRRYPNLVDNMYVARLVKEGQQ